MLVAKRRPLQKLRQPLAERVGELGHDPGEPSVRPVAPVKRHGVEHVPEDAELGEREHALDDGTALRAEADDGLLQRRAVAVQVVAIAKRDDVPAIAGDQGEPTLDLRKLVQVEQEIRDAVAERVACSAPGASA